jgi:hypothetical protein
MKIFENRFSDPEPIKALADKYADLFTDYPNRPTSKLFNPYRHDSVFDDDRYHVLHHGRRMPKDLKELICDTFKFSRRDQESEISINRYDRGDYILPHRDSGPIGLFMLTTSAHDGLTLNDENGRFVTVNDKAGRCVVMKTTTWHWVNPIQDKVRYTVVTDPPVVGRPAFKRKSIITPTRRMKSLRSKLAA